MAEIPDPRRWPYVVASPFGAAGIDEATTSVERIDPHRLSSEPFLDLIERLAAVFHSGERGAFPRWALYDCAEVPGGVIGVAVRGSEASPSVRETLQVPPAYRGLVPVSMVVAVPMLETGAWHLYRLGALEDSAAQALDLAISLLGIRSVVGVTAWGSPDLHLHTQLGPIEVLTAWTPAHTEPATLTYRVEVGDVAPAAIATTSIACGDVAALGISRWRSSPAGESGSSGLRFVTVTRFASHWRR